MAPTKISSPLVQNFASNVRELRLSRNLSQERLAEECDLHRTYVSSVERGERNIGLANVEKIAKALGVPPSTLLEERN
jgi:transcriptional regulator with XRE-family HTH domain